MTTAPDCAEPGPRSHILGIIGGFEACGWQVSRLIAGDLLGTGRGATDGGRIKPPGRVLAADLARLAAGAVLGPLAASRAKGMTLCYERLGLMQQLGAALRPAGVPWVLETQSLCAVEAAGARRSTLLPGLAAAIERNAYRSCDLVVAVSQAVCDEVCAFADLPRDRVLVLPNGVDLAAVRPSLRSPSAGAPLIVGFVGTVVAWQNLPELIAAVGRLRRSGCDLRLRIAGDGGGLDEARAAATAAGPGAVEFVGRITHAEVGPFLAGVDLGYSGQRAEAGRQMYHSPLKLGEYMAAGLPVIASRYPDAVAAAAGVAEDLLFEPGSPGGLEAVLAWAWQNRAVLPAIGATMRRRAEERLGWGGRVEKLLSMLRSRGLLR